MSRKGWTDDETAALQALYPHTPMAELTARFGCNARAIYAKAKKLGLRKTAEYLASPHACRLRRGNNVGAAYRFAKGHVPANKGRKSECPPGCEATWFKPGQHPHTWKPVGSERRSKEGYLQRKLTDTGYPPRDWVCVHHIVWREAGRDIPTGYRLTFVNGDKTDIRLDNLALVSVADLMRRNSFRTTQPPEVVKAIEAHGALVRLINIRTRRSRPNEHD